MLYEGWAKRNESIDRPQPNVIWVQVLEHRKEACQQLPSWCWLLGRRPALFWKGRNMFGSTWRSYNSQTASPSCWLTWPPLFAQVDRTHVPHFTTLGFAAFCSKGRSVGVPRRVSLSQLFLQRHLFTTCLCAMCWKFLQYFSLFLIVCVNLGGSDSKDAACSAGTQIQSLGWEDTLWREWQLTPVFLPGKSRGQRSLAGYIQSIGSQRVKHDWVT